MVSESKLGQIDSYMPGIKEAYAEVKAFEDTMRAHTERAAALRDEAAQEEAASRQGWEARVQAMADYLAANPVNGGVGWLKTLSFDQMIVVFPGDEVYIHQRDPNGDMVDHWLPPTRRKEMQRTTTLDAEGNSVTTEVEVDVVDEERPCLLTGRRIRIGETNVAPMATPLVS